MSLLRVVPAEVVKDNPEHESIPTSACEIRGRFFFLPC